MDFSVNVLSVVNTKMTRNLKTLTIREKRRVLEKLKSGRKKEMVKKFGIPVNTLSTITKNNRKIDLNFSIDRKRKRGPEFSDVKNVYS